MSTIEKNIYATRDLELFFGNPPPPAAPTILREDDTNLLREDNTPYLRE